jgi:superfamily II DNA helicase RecQ
MTNNLQPDNNVDLLEDVQLVLKCAQALGGYYGLLTLVDFICGKRNKKFYERHLNHMLFGTGKYNTETYWKTLSKYMNVTTCELIEKNTIF